MKIYLTVAAIVFVVTLTALYTPIGAAMLRGAASERRERLNDSDWRVWIPLGALVFSLAWPVAVAAILAASCRGRS